ncbi:MAG TPA: PBP1A family penicillin-binding protein [Chloroflexia bacterium]
MREAPQQPAHRNTPRRLPRSARALVAVRDRVTGRLTEPLPSASNRTVSLNTGMLHAANGNGSKARVQVPGENGVRVRVASSVGKQEKTPLPVAWTRPLPKRHPKGTGAHSRRPLFILRTAQRRKARLEGARGGYYARLPKRRSVPGFVKWFMAASSSLMLFVLFFVVLTLGSVGGAYLWITSDLPSVDDVHAGGIQFETSRIYDRYGNLLYELYDTEMGKRTYVTVDKMPKDLIDATIAVEDASFQENNGVDPLGIVRAAYINYTNQGTAGGSTITQQVVRRILLPEKDERTFLRKIREAILAVRMTEKYPKEKILEIYMNEIYYGSLSYGVAAAADTYWGKPIHDLTLAQSAMLAGLPQAPGDYDLNVNFDLAKARQKIVLDLMVKNSFIDQEQADLAYAEDIRPRVLPPHVPTKAPHFVEYARQVLIEKYGHEMALRGGLRVVTTIDLDWQAEAEKIAAAQIQNLRRQGASNAGLVAINPRTGEIMAMVGSVDYSNAVFGQVNVATSLRQPGSSIKPITYAAALERGDYNPYTILPDLPVKYADGSSLVYAPRNYDGRFHGPVTMKAALANSFNIPAVKVLEDVGLPGMLDLAHRLGITTLNDPERYGLSLTLGGGEVKLVDMTAAFATFANYGYRVPATPFLKVVDGDGKVLEEVDLERPQGKQVLNPGVAYQISSMLSDNQARTPIFGANSPLHIPGIDAAVKTGTTDDSKDAWTMGYTPALAVGVWVGNNDGRRMGNVAGAIGAAPIWHNFIKTVYSDPKLKSRLYAPGRDSVEEHFVPPTGMVRAAVCAVSGKAPTSACTHLRYEYFTAENLPTEECDWHHWVPVTLHDGGAHLAGAGVPHEDVIERIYTIPPKEYRNWIGGGPPGQTLVITETAQAPVMVLPTPVAEAPLSIAAMLTPMPSQARGQAGGPAGVAYEEYPEPIPGLQLAIYSPGTGQTVSGLVLVNGQAGADDFARYRLEYGFGSGDAGMTTIVEATELPMLGTLGLWNTEGLQPGPYTLRLTVETLSGSVVRRDVRVRVGTASPSVALLSPADGQGVYDGEVLEILVAPDGGGAQVAGVEIYVDGRHIDSMTSEPWVARWVAEPGEHYVEAIVYTALGEQARSLGARINSQGVRPTPTATRAPIMWISRPTLYQEVRPGEHDIWIDVTEGSRVHHVDIYIDGLPGGYATGPGYRVNPLWTPTPVPTDTPMPPTPTNTLTVDEIGTATVAAATQEVESTRVAAATQTRTARQQATATARREAENQGVTATAQSAAATASVELLTSTATPIPPTSTPSPSPTATFVVYEKLLDPMLGDYIARIRLTPGRHRLTAIGYDADNREIDRDETWVVVK